MDFPQEIIDQLIKLAQQTAKYDDDDFNAYDYSGGNIDDAYGIGQDDGKISLARQILKQLNIQY